MRAPARHSFSRLADCQIRPFRGLEYRSHPLPFDHRLSPLLGPKPGSQTAFSAASPKTLTGKPFVKLGLSWLSFSRPRDLPAVPEPGPGPAPTVTSRRLPTPAHVQRTCPCEQARSPWADLQPCSCAPTSQHDGLDTLVPRHVRIAPILSVPHGTPPWEHGAIGSNAEIEHWQTEPAGLLQRASVEHGQTTLAVSGSTGTAHDGWLDHPLSLVGSQVYRACCPIERSHAAR